MRERSNVTLPMVSDHQPKAQARVGMSHGSVAVLILCFGEPSGVSRRVSLEERINAVKLLRACGGCLGARRRRRAWKTAISPGELSNEL
jgi:hypothetical protein